METDKLLAAPAGVLGNHFVYVLFAGATGIFMAFCRFCQLGTQIQAGRADRVGCRCS